MTRKRTNMRRLSQGIETLETRKLLAADILAAPMDVALEPAAISLELSHAGVHPSAAVSGRSGRAVPRRQPGGNVEPQV